MAKDRSKEKKATMQSGQHIVEVPESLAVTYRTRGYKAVEKPTKKDKAQAGGDA